MFIFLTHSDRVCQKIHSDPAPDSIRSEIYACIAAVKNYEGKKRILLLNTDSKYTVNLLNSIYEEDFLWSMASNPYIDLMRQLSDSVKNCPAKVYAVHVKKQEKHPGNVEAHNLAYKAANSYATGVYSGSKKRKSLL